MRRKLDEQIVATVTRAKELVVETANAGNNQLKVLTLALLYFHAGEVKKAALNLGTDLPEEVLAHLENPDLAEEVFALAKKAAISNLEIATMIATLFELVGKDLGK